MSAATSQPHLPPTSVDAPPYYQLLAELIRHAIASGLTASEFQSALTVLRIVPDDHARQVIRDCQLRA